MEACESKLKSVKMYQHIMGFFGFLFACQPSSSCLFIVSQVKLQWKDSKVVSLSQFVYLFFIFVVFFKYLYFLIYNLF